MDDFNNAMIGSQVNFDPLDTVGSNTSFSGFTTKTLSNTNPTTRTSGTNTSFFNNSSNTNTALNTKTPNSTNSMNIFSPWASKPFVSSQEANTTLHSGSNSSTVSNSNTQNSFEKQFIPTKNYSNLYNSTLESSKLQEQNSNQIYSMTNYATQSPTFKENTLSENEEHLKNQIKMKELRINALEKDLKKIYDLYKQAQYNEQELAKKLNMQLEQLQQLNETRKNSPPDFFSKSFQRVVNSLHEKEEELQETKLRLEALITAIALRPSKAVTKFGQYDEQEVAHKIVVKIETLLEENKSFTKILSFGKAKEKEILIGLLKSENSDFKLKIKQLEQRLSKVAGGNNHQ